MSNVVIIASEVDIELIVVVIAQDLESVFVEVLTFCNLSHHVGMNELVYLLDRNVHPMVS